MSVRTMREKKAGKPKLRSRAGKQARQRQPILARDREKAQRKQC